LRYNTSCIDAKKKLWEASIAELSPFRMLRNIFHFPLEIIMTQPNKDQTPAKKNVAPPSHESAKKNQQKAEQSEVAGRHKNEGQKGHKGAR
jgi:hypothetical protein